MNKYPKRYKQVTLCDLIGHSFIKRSYAASYQGIITILECSYCGAVIPNMERIKQDGKN